MFSSATIRFASVASVAFAASLPAQTSQAKPAAAPQLQSSLPATQPTTPAPPPPPPTPSQRPPEHALVTYLNGSLSVSADNSSLNQILRQIASDTGMKITGGVADERVFGHYGPADPAQVLASLLDGTGSNMILVHRDPPAPAELILTPRQGGPTPPNPNAAAFEDRPERREPPQPQAPQPDATSSTPVTPAPPANPGTPGGTSPPNSSPPDSPNGIKTPQQIYEQLQRLRQQQSTPPQ